MLSTDMLKAIFIKFGTKHRPLKEIQETLEVFFAKE